MEYLQNMKAPPTPANLHTFQKQLTSDSQRIQEVSEVNTHTRTHYMLHFTHCNSYNVCNSECGNISFVMINVCFVVNIFVVDVKEVTKQIDVNTTAVITGDILFVVFH